MSKLILLPTLLIANKRQLSTGRLQDTPIFVLRFHPKFFKPFNFVFNQRYFLGNYKRDKRDFGVTLHNTTRTASRIGVFVKVNYIDGNPFFLHFLYSCTSCDIFDLNSLFAFYRDADGNPRTKREEDGKPPINFQLQVRQWSENTIQQVSVQHKTM